MNEQGEKKWFQRGCLPRLLTGLATVAVVLCGLLGSLNYLANSTRIPPELIKPPIVAPSLDTALPPANVTTESTSDTAPVASMPGQTDPTPTSKPTHTDPPLDELVKFSGSYADYLDLCARHDPAQRAAATLYRELETQLKDEKIDEVFSFGVFGDPDPNSQNRWRPGSGPLNPARAEWLRAHAGLVDRALRLAEAVPLPTVSLAARLACIERLGHWDPLPGVSCLFWQTTAKILAAEGRRRWQEGDPAGARRTWLGIARLAGQFEPGSSLMDDILRFLLISMADVALHEWLEQPATGSTIADRMNASPADLHELRDELERSHRELFSRKLANTGFTGEYQLQRAFLVINLSGSWQNEIYGWDVGDLINPTNNYALNLPVAGGVTLPRLDKVALTSVRAMARKGRSAATLRNYDARWRNEIDRLALPYPTLHASPDPHTSGWVDNLPHLWVSDALSYQVRAFLSEAGLNLDRAAVEWLLSEPEQKSAILTATAAPPPATAAPPDPESPWRDPFTERPFRVETLPARDAATTGTLIYSLGPDLEDQRGQLAYDPSNGTISPGDVSIEVAPPMKPMESEAKH